jgi:tRNA pseudouridine38-40 synthase
MPRYRMVIEYDGAPYKGWQRQLGQPSVQEAVETAIREFCGDIVSLRTAGRTDTGVHATGQVSHADLVRDWPALTVFNAVNARLRVRGEPVALLDVAIIPETFDARFSAIGRHYLYRILDRPVPSPLRRNHVWAVNKPLDIAAMADAATVLLGTHDFTTFRSMHCQSKSPVKTLEQLDVTRVGDEIHFNVAARSFLHNQVRSLAGTLKHVGEGRWTKADVAGVLDAKDRNACGVVAPPQGLCLMQVDYDGWNSSQVEYRLHRQKDRD